MRALSPLSRCTILILLIASVLATTLFAGIKNGADTKFPGPMVRHRDAAAIAITYLRYDSWLNYASYKSVNKRLNDFGLSLESRVWEKFGGGMLDLMQRPQIMNAALAAALDIPDPATEGLYFIDNDEKGMSLFYIFCFSLFGYNVAGFFYGYMLLLTISAGMFCFSFFRRPDILFVGLAVAIAHFAAVLVCQQLEPDVNVVHSSRFLGLVSLYASLHLSFLLATRANFSAISVIPALIQTTLLVFICLARNSAIWEFFPVFLLAGLLWLKERHVKFDWHSLWPTGVATLGLLAILAHNTFLLHPHYYTAASTKQHVFWHALALGLHNNPDRAKYGIPDTVQPWEDTVAHIIFQQEIAKRGQTWADYETKNADQKQLNGIDLAWGAYEGVLREAILRTALKDPLYALRSFLIYQPISIVQTLFSSTLFDMGRILDWRILVALALGALVAIPTIRLLNGAGILALSVTFLASLTPVIIVAPTTNRVLEAFVLLLACGLIALCSLLGSICSGRLLRSP